MISAKEMRQKAEKNIERDEIAVEKIAREIVGEIFVKILDIVEKTPTQKFFKFNPSQDPKMSKMTHTVLSSVRNILIKHGYTVSIVSNRISVQGMETFSGSIEIGWNGK